MELTKTKANRIVEQIINSLRKGQIRPEKCSWDSCVLRYEDLMVGVDYGSREVVFNYLGVKISWLLWKQFRREIEISKSQKREIENFINKVIKALNRNTISCKYDWTEGGMGGCIAEKFEVSYQDIRVCLSWLTSNKWYKFKDWILEIGERWSAPPVKISWKLRRELLNAMKRST